MKNHKKLYIPLVAALLSTVALDVSAQESDSLVQMPFGVTAREDLLGGVSSVNVAQLLEKDYHIGALGDLSAFVGGLNGGVWGQNPLIVIDGSPRESAYVRATEIESVTVLKAASAVALYGSKGAKGAILITTKHGKEEPLKVSVRANTGMWVAKSYPEYLGAAEYMTLYNEAYRNDGHTDKDYYDASTIYNTATGTNPYRYPDMNFYSSEYLKKAYNQTDGTVEISGGTDKARYYANFGTEYAGSMVK
ncbi:MAG: TonB-dependent receptor plug domain-containing protein, partial [Bacteroidales bacterium]|nr:TonB-dependent receptor plug domain-containing protein [Bacteroidales bacterium]